MGFMMAEQELISEVKRDLLCVAMFFICLGLESLLMVSKFHVPLAFLWISVLPMIWFVLRLSLTIPMRSKLIYYILRKVSTICYVMYIVVLKVLKYILRILGVSDSANLKLTILTIVITIVLSYGVYQSSSRKVFTWLRYMI